MLSRMHVIDGRLRPTKMLDPIPALMMAFAAYFCAAAPRVGAQSGPPTAGTERDQPKRRNGPELGFSLSGALTTNESDGGRLSRQFLELGVSAGWTLVRGRDVSLQFVPAVIPIAISTHDANYQYVPPPPCTGTCPADVGGGTSIVTYHTVYGFGVVPLGAELHVLRRAPVSVVVGGSGGILWFTRAIPQNNAAKFNFTAAGLTGLQFRTSAHTAVRFGYQYHHTSNGHSAASNPGLNSSMLVISVLREP
jgi:hypothetical protein